MDWIPLVSLILSFTNTVASYYYFRVANSAPPYTGKHRKRIRKKRKRH